MNDTLVQARTRLTEQQGQLDTLQREKSNLSTINDGLSSHIEKTQTSLSKAESRVLEISTQLTACDKEQAMQRDTVLARLDDKDQLIETLQLQSKSGRQGDET